MRDDSLCRKERALGQCKGLESDFILAWASRPGGRATRIAEKRRECSRLREQSVRKWTLWTGTVSLRTRRKISLKLSRVQIHVQLKRQKIGIRHEDDTNIESNANSSGCQEKNITLLFRSQYERKSPIVPMGPSPYLEVVSRHYQQSQQARRSSQSP